MATKSTYTQATILNGILAHADMCADFGGIPSEEVKAFCEKKLAQLQNKTAKVDTAKAEARAELFEDIKSILADGKATASEVMKSYNAMKGEDFSLPKITNALTALVNNGDVVRTTEKKVAYFDLA
jgi:hypothetical protein